MHEPGAKQQVPTMGSAQSTHPKIAAFHAGHLRHVVESQMKTPDSSDEYSSRLALVTTIVSIYAEGKQAQETETSDPTRKTHPHRVASWLYKDHMMAVAQLLFPSRTAEPPVGRNTLADSPIADPAVLPEIFTYCFTEEAVVADAIAVMAEPLRHMKNFTRHSTAYVPAVGRLFRDPKLTESCRTAALRQLVHALPEWVPFWRYKRRMMYDVCGPSSVLPCLDYDPHDKQQRAHAARHAVDVIASLSEQHMRMILYASSPILFPTCGEYTERDVHTPLNIVCRSACATVCVRGNRVFLQNLKGETDEDWQHVSHADRRAQYRLVMLLMKHNMGDPFYSPVNDARNAVYWSIRLENVDALCALGVWVTQLYTPTQIRDHMMKIKARMEHDYVTGIMKPNRPYDYAIREVTQAVTTGSVDAIYDAHTRMYARRLEEKGDTATADETARSLMSLRECIKPCIEGLRARRREAWMDVDVDVDTGEHRRTQ